ncbi:hypothetical protein [Modestobacter italicus]|uniref:hypothetical protein n=1 Tax=Modestobacter italicus (strain DSM 44449 / CECT 9708 / BC 501) TaxID=2732864 RepID=UPI001C9581C5|nr:hypothetical protein [Modestobacter italicus]
MTGAEPGRPVHLPPGPARGAPRPVGRVTRARRLGRRVLSRPRLVVPAAALLYLVGMSLPWFRMPGSGGRAALTVNGFDAGMLVAAAGALGLAAVWAVLPGRVLPRLPFPAPLVTAGLTVLCLLLTVPEWLTTSDRGFTWAGLLTVLSAAAAAAAALTAAVAAVRSWPPAPPRSAAGPAAEGVEEGAAGPEGDGGAGQPAETVPDGEVVIAGPGLGRPWAVEARE